MDRPTLPENIETLSLADLTTWVEGAREFVSAQLSADEPDLEFLESFADAAELLGSKIEAETKSKALKARASAALSVETEEAPAETEEVDDEEPAEEDEDEAEDAETEDAAETDPADADAATDTETVVSSGDAADDETTDLTEVTTDTEEPEVDKPNADDLAGDTGAEDLSQVDDTVVPTSARILAGVPGFEAGTPVESRIQVGKALASKWNAVNGASGEQFAVISVETEYPEFANFADGNFEGFYDDSIVAACAPLQPIYDVGFYSSEARPVFASLPKFGAPRGGVTIYPSPLFSDADLIESGVGMGQWTIADDNNPAAEKNDPYELECDTPEEFRIWAVYKSMNIRNLDAQTFPELVAAHTNQLGARFARYAEKLLLNAMIARSDEEVHASATYGASRTILSRFDQISARFRENERLDDSGILDGWFPRWIRDALREDVIRAANDSGIPEVVVDATIKSWFADMGIDANFTYDNPSLYGDLALQSTGHVAGWPDHTWYILTPKSNLGVLDLGRLDVGVNPNGTYRDSVLNKRNRFQVFMESFEGLVDRGAPVWTGEVEVLANGAQPAGVTAISSNTNI